jgi:response regulator NasT
VVEASPSPRIAIVDESVARSAIIAAGLRDGGYENIVIIGKVQALLAEVVRIDPDVILIDLENPSRDVLEQMFTVSRVVRRPIAMFVDHSDDETIEAAVEAGVSAYIVDGFKKERMKPILNMCISRFNAFARLEAELQATKTKLQKRELVDRAKLLLMERRNIPESEAYALMRRAAMNEKKQIAEIAHAILTASELLE